MFTTARAHPTAAAWLGAARATRFDVVCAGEALWDLAPPEGQALRFRPGGGAVSAALALARAGLRVGLAAALADHASSRALVARVAASGVDTGGVSLAPACAQLVVPEGATEARHLVAHRPEDELPMAIPEGWVAPVLLLSGVSPALGPMSGLCRAARAARRAGSVVVVDLNARWHIWAGRDPRTLHALLREADVVRCSGADLLRLGIEERQVRAALRPSAVLTLTQGPGAARAVGPFGVVVRSPSEAIQARAAGAGDAFTAALCLELARTGDHAPERSDVWTRTLERAHAAAVAAIARR